MGTAVKKTISLPADLAKEAEPSPAPKARR
jgi:hypothetical protein